MGQCALCTVSGLARSLPLAGQTRPASAACLSTVVCWGRRSRWELIHVGEAPSRTPPRAPLLGCSFASPPSSRQLVCQGARSQLRDGMLLRPCGGCGWGSGLGERAAGPAIAKFKSRWRAGVLACWRLAGAAADRTHRRDRTNQRYNDTQRNPYHTNAHIPYTLPTTYYPLSFPRPNVPKKKK